MERDRDLMNAMEMTCDRLSYLQLTRTQREQQVVITEPENPQALQEAHMRIQLRRGATLEVNSSNIISTRGGHRSEETLHERVLERDYI